MQNRKQLWIIISAVSGILVLGIVIAMLFFRGNQDEQRYTSIMITAQKTGAAGVEPDSGFNLLSQKSMNEDMIRKALVFQPSVSYTLQGKGKEWSILPEEPLKENTVYSIQVQKPDGGLASSFAFQTKTALSVASVYPSDGSEYVETQTGIEIQFNTAGANAEGFLEIKPEISGRLEQSGYAAVFVPDQPLESNSVYRVTLRAGLPAANGTKLEQDYSFSFTTHPGDQENYGTLQLQGNFIADYLPGDPVRINMYGEQDVIPQTFDVTVHRYSGADAFIQEVVQRDAYYRERYGHKTDYLVDTSELEEVFSYHGLLEANEDPYSSQCSAVLPELNEGFYVATVYGKNSNGVEQRVQQLLQVSNLSLYTQSVDGETLVWLNDPVSGKPVSGATVDLEDSETGQAVSGATGEDGTVLLNTGEIHSAYLRLLNGESVAYFNKLSLSKEAEDIPLEERFYSALYTDRNIYQPTDTIRFWGVVRERSGGKVPPDTVAVSLRAGWPENTIYQSSVNVDPLNGTYEGEISITGLNKDYYSLIIGDGEEGVYQSLGISIGEYTKPPFVIQVEHSKEWYYADEPIDYTVTATYYDGTPVAGGKILLDVYGLSGLDEGGTILTLDDQGKAVYTGTYKTPNELNNWEPQTLWASLRSADTEDVYIGAEDMVIVLPSRVCVKLEVENPVSVSISAASLEESKVLNSPSVRPLIYQDDFDRLSGSPLSLSAELKITKYETVKIPTGQYYDAVHKKTVQKYKTERKESVALTKQVEIVNGSLNLPDLLPEPDWDNTIRYEYELTFDGGVIGTVKATASYWPPYRDTRETYGLSNADYSERKVKTGSSITLGLYRNDEKISNTGRILYTAHQRKMVSKEIIADGQNEFQVTYPEEWAPNVYFAGAYFDGRYTHPLDSCEYTIDYTDKTLTLDITADQEQYAPSGVAKLTISLKDSAGQPVEGTACVGVVDESVFDLFEQEVDIAAQLYRSVYSPYLSQNVWTSTEKGFVEEPETAMDAGAARKADPGTGGGAEVALLREEFRDTAFFQTVKTDASGMAVVELTLPDNITSWRVTAAAVTEDLKGGSNTDNIITTIPFVLRPLFSNRYLEGDDVSIALRSAYEDSQAEVTYSVRLTPKAGGETIEQSGKGPAAQPIFIRFGKLAAGEYELTVSGSCGEFSDSVKNTFSVVKAGLTTPVTKNITLEEFNALDSARYPVYATFYDKQLSGFMKTLESLENRQDYRTEICAAQYSAQLLHNQLLPENQRKTPSKNVWLDAMQDWESGGVRILENAEPDPATTAKMLIAAPELINSVNAEKFLMESLSDPAASMDERVMALVGLASTKKPVLGDIRSMLTLESLTIAQKLNLAGGLAMLGDFGGAKQVLSGVSMESSGDGLLNIPGNSELERLTNTAAALIPYIVLQDSQADQLAAYLCESLQGQGPEEQKAVVSLEMLAYLKFFRYDGSSNAKLSYTADGQKQEASLNSEGYYSAAFSQENLKSAGVKAVSGEVMVSASFSFYEENVQTAENSGITIEKTVTPVSGDLSVAGMAQVEVKIVLPEDAPTGCYTLSDEIPSGMRFLPVQTGGGKGEGALDRDLNNEGQTMSGTFYYSRDMEPRPLDTADSGSISEEIAEITLDTSEALRNPGEVAWDEEAETDVQKPDPGMTVWDEEPETDVQKPNPGMTVWDEEPEIDEDQPNPGTLGDFPEESGAAVSSSEDEEPEIAKINPDTTDPGFAVEEEEPEVDVGKPNPGIGGDLPEENKPNEFVFRYFVNCVLPGEFVAESTCVVYPDSDTAVKTERTMVQISE